jgi:tetratricopeptide (TPR) repeat protein
MALDFKARGDSAIASADYASAVDSYTRGNRVQHSPVFDYNLARALQGLGRYADALDALERFQRDAPVELKARVQDLDAMVRELRANVGFVLLQGEPVEANIRGNRLDWGAYEPSRRIRCDAGSLDLEVRAEGFEPIERKLTITAGATETVKLKFIPKDERATVQVAASLTGARVMIDGRGIGQTPLEAKLDAGTHRLRLEHADYEPLDTDIVVVAREHRKLSYDLQRHPAIWSRWWFWTGAAAVVAAGVIAGVALSTSRSPTPGDIQPGVVSAPILAPR